MVTKAKKVWCPKCHKRHQLPPDVGEMTLRCRKCRFAFYLSDGLTTDPAIEKAPVLVGSAAKDLSAKGQPAKDDSLDLDDNYDDILDVLARPDDPLAPPRAHAKPKSSQPNQPIDDEGKDKSGHSEEAEHSQPIAQPVTRERLQAHKNTRRILMLVSFLFACVLCVVSWFIGRDLADQPLGDWERKMLYAMGTPARLLPPQNVNDEMLLPVNHVKLRGDFFELADRSDSYRDDFPRPEPEPIPETEPKRERKSERAIATDVPKPVQPNTKRPAPLTIPLVTNSPRATANRSATKRVDTKSTAPKKPETKLERQGLLLPNQMPVDPDEYFTHELARSPIFSAPLESLVALADNRIAFFVKDKDYQAFGFAEREQDQWSIKPIELGTKLTVTGFDITEDGSRIAIWSKDIIQFWEIDESGTAKQIAESASHTADVTQLKLTNDGKKAVSGDRSGKLFVSVFETGQQIDSVEGFRTPIKRIVAKGAGGFVAMDQRGITRSVRAPIAPFSTLVSGACALSLNGTKLAFVRNGREVVVADVGSRKVIETFQVEPTCSWLAFADDLKHLITQDRSDVAVWNWRRSVRLRVFRFKRNQNGRPVPVAITSDSQTVVVATGEQRNQISVYEMPGAETKSE